MRFPITFIILTLVHSMTTAQNLGISIPPIPSISIPPIPSISIPPIPSISIPPIPSISFPAPPRTTVRSIKNIPGTSTISASDNCTTCVSNSMMLVPACMNLTNFNPETIVPRNLTPQVAACFCFLTYDFSWIQSCAGPCPDSFISSMEHNYTSIRGTVPCAAALEHNSSASLVTVSQWAIGGMVLTTLVAAMLL